MQGDDGIDPAVKERIEALKTEKKNASEDEKNISAGLVAMQNKLMEMEAHTSLCLALLVYVMMWSSMIVQEDKLQVDCTSSKKKVFKIVVVGDANVGKVCHSSQLLHEDDHCFHSDKFDLSILQAEETRQCVSNIGLRI